MKTKVLLGVAAIGIVTAFTAPARAGVSFDIRIGLPLPPLPSIIIEAPRPPRVVIAPPPVCAPPVVVVRPPFPVCPPPVVVHHPRFIPPGHAKRYEHVDYRHRGHGKKHGRH